MMPSSVGLGVGHKAVLADIHIFTQQSIFGVFIRPAKVYKNVNKLSLPIKIIRKKRICLNLGASRSLIKY